MPHPNPSPQITEQRIREILAAHPEAQRLWEYVRDAFHPVCLEIGATVSSYNLNLQWIGNEHKVQSGMPPLICIAAGTQRVAAALSHELLHMELARLGYPRLIQNSVNDDERNKINSVLNVIDHTLMLPRFVGLGISQADFLSNDVCSDDLIARCMASFSVAGEVDQPLAYFSKLRTFLDSEQFGSDAWFAKFEDNQWQEIEDITK